MKIGLVARADDRGIGTMTRAFYRNMLPQKTLLVREPGAEQRGFAPHLDWYPDAHVSAFDPIQGRLDEGACRRFLDGLDVVYMVETPYDARFFGWARQARAATVLHVMPEFWKWGDVAEPRPDAFWLPTGWRQGLLPADCRVVEVPVEIPDRPIVPRADGPVVFVHVAGRYAAADRNGTRMLYASLRSLDHPCVVRVFTQEPRLPRVQFRNGVEFETFVGGVGDRWSMYDDADVLVMPRKYGGLCLPALEAMGCGLGLAMTAVEPQLSTWPIMPIRAVQKGSITTAAGEIPLHVVPSRDMVIPLDRLASNRDAVAALKQDGRTFAAEHSWEHCRATYLEEFERAIERRSPVVA